MPLSRHEQQMYAAKIENGKHGIVQHPERDMAQRLMELHWEITASVEHEGLLLEEVKTTRAALAASEAARRQVEERERVLREALKPYAEMERSDAYDSDGELIEVWDAPAPSIAEAALAASPSRPEPPADGLRETAEAHVKVLAPYRLLLESLMHHCYQGDGDPGEWLGSHQPAITDAMSDYDDWLDALAAAPVAAGDGLREAALRDIEPRMVSILRDEETPLYACRDCHGVGYDAAANVEHTAWCVVTLARGALAAAPVAEGRGAGEWGRG